MNTQKRFQKQPQNWSRFRGLQDLQPNPYDRASVDLNLAKHIEIASKFSLLLRVFALTSNAKPETP